MPHLPGGKRHTSRVWMLSVTIAYTGFQNIEALCSTRCLPLRYATLKARVVTLSERASSTQIAEAEFGCAT